MPDPRNRLKWNATCKAYPAICDKQAPTDTIRVYEEFTVIDAGNTERLLYECPADRCAYIEYAWAYEITGNPGSLYFMIKVGAVDYTLSIETHGAWQHHPLRAHVFLKPGDFFKSFWSACHVGDVLYGTVVGYEMALY